MELDPVAVWLIGIAAMVLVSLVKLYENKSGKKFSTVVLQWGVFVVALGIALISTVPVFPPLDLSGDPTQIIAAVFVWLTAVITAVGPFFTVATLVYVTLWKKVTDEWVPPLFRRAFRK